MMLGFVGCAEATGGTAHKISKTTVILKFIAAPFVEFRVSMRAPADYFAVNKSLPPVRSYAARAAAWVSSSAICVTLSHFALQALRIVHVRVAIKDATSGRS